MAVGFLIGFLWLKLGKIKEVVSRLCRNDKLR